MALADYEIAGPPDMTAADFARVLVAANSPASVEATPMYAALVEGGVRPAVALAFFGHESSYGTKGICKTFGTKSLGNVRTPEVPGEGRIVVTTQGGYAAYPTWAAGARDWARRMRGPKYAGAGLTTIRQVLPKYAPASENDVGAYIASVLADIQRFKETSMKRIALASGHHNSSGGDAFEYQQTGELCEAVARACAALGMEVRVVQPDGPDADSEPGDGTIAGSLDVVGNTVVAWVKAGWVADIFLECHTEGGGGTGVFAIYPDAPGDVDADVRDTLGPDVARRVAAATGLGIGGLRIGTMSERETGVGRDGFRLGIFRTTAPIASTTTRLIVEYGAHDKQPDLAIVKRPGFFDAAGKATAVAFAAFLGLPTQPNAGSVVEAPAAPAPTTDERDALLSWSNSLPLVARGNLTREGIADLSAFPSGKAEERIAVYERLVTHRLGGQNYVLTLALWDDLRKQGKVVLY